METTTPFAALYALAGHCPAIMITAAREGTGKLRINIVPQCPAKKDGEPALPDEAVKAFTKPLTLVGTVAELDAEFSTAVTTITENHASIRDAIAASKADIVAAEASIRATGKNAAAKSVGATTAMQKATKKMATPDPKPLSVSGPQDDCAEPSDAETAEPAEPEPTPEPPKGFSEAAAKSGFDLSTGLAITGPGVA